MTPVALLRAHSRHAPWNARGLAAHVTALVDAAGIRPTNASARVAPSARSVRFYVASGLLDRPEGAGTAATYNYRHLLQLLSIKIRQREGATLDGIKKEMKEVTGDAIERRPSRRPLGPAPMLPCATVTRNDPPAGVASPSPTASRSTCATTPPPRATRPSSPCAKPSAPPWEERIFAKSWWPVVGSR